MSLWLDYLGAEISFIETVSFGKIRVAQAGNKNLPPLIFMHGIGGHLEAYAKNLVALSNQFHVISFDFLGMGLSNKPAIDYSPILLVEQLAELMNAMDLGAAHLSGESLGGWIAGLFSVKYPNRVLKLNLNTAAGLPIVTDKGRQDLENLVNLTKQASTQGPPTFASVKKRMEWLFHPANQEKFLTDELINTRLSFYLSKGSKEAAPRVLSMIGQHDDFLIPLSKIQQPTLLIWTNDNPVHDTECARNANVRIPNSELYIMKSAAAHWPQYEAADEFNEVLSSFLARD